MRPLLKLVLCQERAAAKKARDMQKVELIDLALQNDDVLDVLEVAAQAEYDYEHPKQGLSGGFGDVFANILKYLMDHRAEILALIQTIFSVLAVLEKEQPK